MRFYPAVHTDTVGSEAVDHVAPGAESTWNKTLESVMLMQSSIEKSAITPIDILAIESQARAARSAWIAKEIKAFTIALGRRLERVVTGLSNEVKVLLARPIKH